MFYEYRTLQYYSFQRCGMFLLTLSWCCSMDFCNFNSWVKNLYKKGVEISVQNKFIIWHSWAYSYVLVYAKSCILSGETSRNSCIRARNKGKKRAWEKEMMNGVTRLCHFNSVNSGDKFNSWSNFRNPAIDALLSHFALNSCCFAAVEEKLKFKHHSSAHCFIYIWN